MMDEYIIDIPDNIESVNWNDVDAKTRLTGLPLRENIIRCRDCDRSRENGWKCTRWVTGHWDEDQEADVIELADVKPNGFCAWAERDA